MQRKGFAPGLNSTGSQSRKGMRESQIRLRGFVGHRFFGAERIYEYQRYSVIYNVGGPVSGGEGGTYSATDF